MLNNIETSETKNDSSNNPTPQDLNFQTVLPKRKILRDGFFMLFVFVILLLSGYFAYLKIRTNNSGQNPNQKEVNQEKVVTSETPTKVTAAQMKSISLEKTAKLNFPVIQSSSTSTTDTVPDALRTLLADAKEVKAEKINFADNTTGLRVSFYFNSTNLLTVFENIIRLQELTQLSSMIAGRTEKFAFSDFQNNEFKARLSLTLEEKNISGEILANYK